MKEKKKNIIKKILKVFLIIVFIVSVIALAVSVYKIIFWHKYNKESSEVSEEIVEQTTVEEVVESPDKNITQVNPPKDKNDSYYNFVNENLINVDFNDLIKQNNNTVAWIKINGTNINYPVVQYKNNDFYLNHSFNKSYNDAGWIFMDYRNNPVNFSKNTVIYGHSRLDHTMFYSLRNITKKSWFNNKDNHIVKLSTPTKNTLWQVFSVYTIKAESYYITTDFDSEASYKEWLKDMLNRSLFNFKTSINTNDKVLTLSSCYTSNDVRMVLHAKLIKEEVR